MNRILQPFIFVILPGVTLHAYIEFLTTGLSLYFYRDVLMISSILLGIVLYKFSKINRKNLFTLALYSIIIAIMTTFVIGYFDPNFQLENTFLHCQMITATVMFAAGTMVRLKHLMIINIMNILLIVFCSIMAENGTVIWRFVFSGILVSGGGFVAYAGQSFVRKLYREVKKARAANEEQNAELKRMNNAKDQLFRIIGHDLRTPFHQLNLLVDLMAQSEDKEQIEEYRKLIRASAIKGTGLLEDLMGWSQDIGDSKVKLEESLVSTLVDKTFEFFKFNCGVKEIKLINELPKDLTLKISDSMMETVFRNLIGNAIKFSHMNSDIVVSSMERGDFIDILVKDQGVGISSERLEMLLSEGKVVSTKGTNNEKGTGYGLGIVKKLVERQNGSFSIRSKEKKGTTVTLSFSKN